MTTPYDAALRLRQREMDDMRVLITVEVNQLTILDEHRERIDTSVRAEVALAAGWALPSSAFVARMDAEREALRHERLAGAARLDALRAQAIEVYGSLSAIGAAVDQHRAEHLRVASLAEQSQTDDFSAARFSRILIAARRVREARDTYA